jgi:hypothetical protein
MTFWVLTEDERERRNVMRAEENRLVNALFAIRRELADFEQEIAAKRPPSTLVAIRTVTL